MTFQEQVQSERARQVRLWGTAQDDANTPFQWGTYISQYATRSLVGAPGLVNVAKFREDMVKVAALAQAAVEAIDRKAGE